MASKKVSMLNALTSAGDDDLLYIADTSDSGASYASKRITVQNFLNGTASLTALTTEEGARAAADAALSGRLDTLEADPTTASALSAEIAARTSGDSALSGRLDTLEADPTTATAVTNAIATETAARQAADALLLPLAGGTMTGAINLGVSSSDSVTFVRSALVNGDMKTTSTLILKASGYTNVIQIHSSIGSSWADGLTAQWFYTTETQYRTLQEQMQMV